MKKQSGFTLIELMVVMAIIAILATAGLNAYTGYIKKSRDTVRIADLSALNTIVLSSVPTTGLPPINVAALIPLIKAANNNKMIKDPLSTAGTGNIFKSSCQNTDCVYMYKICNVTGFNFGAHFESSTSSYTGDAGNDATLYETGNCGTSPVYVTAAVSGTENLANDVLDDDSE